MFKSEYFSAHGYVRVAQLGYTTAYKNRVNLFKNDTYVSKFVEKPYKVMFKTF